MADLTLEPRHPHLEQRLQDQDYGRVIEGSGMVVHVADQPVAIDFKKKLEELGEEIPADVDLYRRYRVWLVPCRMSVVRRQGFAEAVSVGIECEFMNGERTCCVVGLVPGPRYVQHGSVDGSFNFTAGLSAAGELMPLPSPEDSAAPLGTGSTGLSLSASAGVAARLHLQVATPSIQAVGIGSNRVEWQFERESGPLFGRDVEGWSILLLPKKQLELRYKMRVWCSFRTAFFPTRHESGWQEITCRLG